MSRVLLPAAWLAAACAGPTERPPQPPSAYTVQQELGQRDVLQAGAEYARLQGYQVAFAEGEAEEVRPNIWRLRFALAPKGSGKLLQLDFDEATRQVVKSQEIDIVPSAQPPGTGP
ncbi:hypothetical protein P2318_29490 [Myxococcaceae bacterium GXIMD 01537]